MSLKEQKQKGQTYLTVIGKCHSFSKKLLLDNNETRMLHGMKCRTTMCIMSVMEIRVLRYKSKHSRQDQIRKNIFQGKVGGLDM